MKLSECWIGRIVQDKDKTYDETMSSYSLGHVEGFEVLNGNIYVAVRCPKCYIKIYLPEQLKPLED
tara:strand:- start:66 stop:263 length:198 start_codon:yes stop_codon:yes gene_type:complete